MNFTVLRPENLTISEDESTRVFFGGDQEWYQDEWHRKAGCGPTCAANVTAYLAQTHPALRALYAGEDMHKSTFSTHMEALYQFVTPGAMGLNRVEMYTQGVEAFAASRGVALETHAFEVRSYLCRDRAPAAALGAFLRAGLESDCPVAFLNLTKGRVKNIQSWHWITITSAEIDETTVVATASDEGDEIRFDLRLWYLSTRMHGGLVYFSEPKA